MRWLLVAVVGLVAALVAPGVAAAQTEPDPTSDKAVAQQLVVQVPERATPPSTVARAPGPAGSTGPVIGPAPSAGTLPRTGVGPWFGPTVVVALLLLAAGLLLRAVARRLDPQRMAWPQ